MKILLKCPTRTRPERVKTTIKKYIELCNRPDLLGVCISADVDDITMTPAPVQFELRQITRNIAWSNIFYSENKSKIEAVNADMEKIDWEWDIVVLVSDDMIPVHKGYDDVLRSHMMSRFPDTDGILWCNDGFQGKELNTLTIMGRTMYNSFGYIYHPSYKSLFCDTEFTDLCNTTLASKCMYIPHLLIRHEHPGHGYMDRSDSLYERNQRYWTADLRTYISRKTYDHDWDILVPLMSGRETSLHSLLASIHEKKARICPDLRILITVYHDNKENMNGVKLQKFVNDTKGKYISFIDDDDTVTDAYFEDARECIKNNYSVCRLRGEIGWAIFTHSIEYSPTGSMAVGRVFTRPLNHLNIMMREIVKHVRFETVKRWEDFHFVVHLADSKVLTTEYRSDESRIHYIYNVPAGFVTEDFFEQQRNQSMTNMIGTLAPLPPLPPETKKGIKFVLGKGFVSK